LLATRTGKKGLACELNPQFFGSPSWKNFELLKLIQKKPEPVPGNEKGHTLIGYGLESMAPQRGLENGKTHIFMTILALSR
jgi:hypothetical protein